MPEIIVNSERIGDSDIVGDLVPTLYVKRVVLQGGGDVLVKDDPHIREDYVEVIRRSEGTLGEDFRIVDTEVDLNTVIGNPEASQNLKVQINLCLKDKITNNLYTSWLVNSDNVNKYLKSVVFVIKRKSHIDTFDRLTKRNPSLYKRVLLRHLTGLGHADSSLQYGEVLTNIRSILRPNGNHYQRINLNNSMEEFQRGEQYQDQDANFVYDIDLEASFTVENLRPESLAIVTLSYIDIKQLEKDFDITSGTIDPEIATGNMRVYNIIQNGAVADSSVVYYDREGKIWPGAIHYHEEFGYMAGARHTNQPHSILTRRVVPNTLVQDFRNVDEVAQQQIDLSSIDSIFPRVNRFFKEYVESNSGVGVDKALLSDILLSRGINGECKFFFSLDFRQFCKENTKFPKLADYNSSILNNFYIKKISILRRRKVEGSLFEVPQRGEPSYFLSIPHEEVVVYREYQRARGGEIQEGPALTPPIVLSESSVQNTLREVGGLSLNNSFGVKHFSGRDNSISSITFGKYEYGVEVEIYDPTEEYVAEILLDLERSINTLRRYLRLANVPRSGGRQDSLDDNPHIKSSSGVEDLPVNVGRAVGSYDIKSNSFHSSFSDLLVQKYGPEFVSTLQASIANFVGVLRKLGIFINQQPALDFQKKIYQLIEPVRGTPQGIEAVIKMIQDVHSKLLTVTQVAPAREGADSVGATPGDLVISSRTEKRVLKYKKFFQHQGVSPCEFDTETPDNTGYEALGADFNSRSSFGLDNLDIKAFNNRCEAETLKYFRTLSEDISNISPVMTFYSLSDSSLVDQQYSYLSPSHILLKTTEPLSLLNQIENLSERRQRQLQGPLQDIQIDDPEVLTDVSDISSKASEIFRFNRSDKSTKRIPATNYVSNSRTKLSAKQLKTRDNLISVLADSSVTVEVSDRATTQSSGEISNGFVPANRYFSEDAADTADLSLRGEYVNIGIERNENLIDIHTSRDGDVLLANNLLLDMMYNLIVDDEFDSPADFRTRNLDNQRQNKRFYNLNSSANGIKQFVEQDPIITFNALPNQIKSLFVSSVRPNTVQVNYHNDIYEPFKDPQDALALMINYYTLFKIEYLVGFDVAAGLKKQVFARLTTDVLEGLDRPLLCRMVPYVGESLGIKPPAGLQLALLDQYFFIGDVQTDITTFGSTLEGSFSGDDLAATEVILPEFTRLELTTNVTLDGY